MEGWILLKGLYADPPEIPEEPLAQPGKTPFQMGLRAGIARAVKPDEDPRL
jgi:hypothetical protein